MVVSLLSLLLSRTFLPSPHPSPSPFICFSCLPRWGFYRGPFIRGPVLVPPSPPSFTFRVALLIPAAAASSCRLDSFLLSWRERLNSLRPFFAPVLLSSSFSFVFVATSRPPTVETVAVEAYECFKFVLELLLGHILYLITKTFIKVITWQEVKF